MIEHQALLKVATDIKVMVQRNKVVAWSPSTHLKATDVFGVPEMERLADMLPDEYMAIPIVIRCLDEEDKPRGVIPLVFVGREAIPLLERINRTMVEARKERDKIIQSKQVKELHALIVHFLELNLTDLTKDVNSYFEKLAAG